MLLRNSQMKSNDTYSPVCEKEMMTKKTGQVLQWSFLFSFFLSCKVIPPLLLIPICFTFFSLLSTSITSPHFVQLALSLCVWSIRCGRKLSSRRVRVRPSLSRSTSPLPCWNDRVSSPPRMGNHSFKEESKQTGRSRGRGVRRDRLIAIFHS